MKETRENEKEALLSEIKHYQQLVNQYAMLSNQLTSFYRKPFTNFPVHIRAAIIGIMLLAILGGLSAGSGKDAGTVFLFTLGLFGLFFVWPSIVVQNKVKRNQNTINQLRENMARIENSITPEYLPPVYINRYALLKLEEYLVNKRADSLKEAINLFEQEKQMNMQMQQLNEIKQIQEQTYHRTNEAVVLGWVNMFRR